MAINPFEFYPHNIIDTCAVWNILSSKILFSRAYSSGVMFYCTNFVVYECLYKQRSKPKEYHVELKNYLKQLMEQGKFVSLSLSVEDLHEIDRLSSRKRLGKGELSTLAFAMKTGQAFLSDDQKARKLALSVLPAGRTQTTPHLFSRLIFLGKISDSEKIQVIEELLANDGDISPHLEAAYIEGCRCRYTTTGAT